VRLCWINPLKHQGNYGIVRIDSILASLKGENVKRVAVKSRASQPEGGTRSDDDRANMGRVSTAQGLHSSDNKNANLAGELPPNFDELAVFEAATSRQTRSKIDGEPLLNEIQEHVLRVLARQLGAHCANLWFGDGADPGSGSWISCEACRIGSDLYADSRRTPCAAGGAADPMWQQLVDSQSPVLFDRVGESPRARHYHERCSAQGVRWILAVPLVENGHVAGAIRICSCETQCFREAQIELAQALAQQITLSHQLARFAEQSRQEATLEERTRLARDLHDTLSQSLTGVVLQLEAAQTALESGLAD
jgi:hypothetical protein